MELIIFRKARFDEGSVFCHIPHMRPLPGYVYSTFGLALLLGLGLFWRATRYSRPFLLILLAWIILQSWLAGRGFYDDPRTMTYRFPLLIIPVAILSLLARSKAGSGFMNRLDMESLTLFHVVRVPVEMSLSWLSLNGALPKEITIWSGENFDILIGLSAPVMYYLYFLRRSINRRALVVWNIAGLILLSSPVVLALLSLPARYRGFGFSRPDVAIGYFPFILLPAALVPLAIFAHFAALGKLHSGPRNTRKGAGRLQSS